MNAPTRIASEPVFDNMRNTGVLMGIARHVSVAGCQFVLSGDEPKAGQRLEFALPTGLIIRGSVSWILGDRIGFGFDQQIGSSTMSTLSAHLGSLTVVGLHPCGSELAPPPAR